MPQGNELSHILDGVTIKGGLAIERRPGIVDYPLTDMYAAPALPAVVFPFDPRTSPTIGTTAASQANGVRVVVPRGGTLAEIAWYIGTSSGNYDLGVYNTAATTITNLYSTGSTACPTGNAWVSASPNLTVTAGQNLYLALAIDNSTATRAGSTLAASAMSNLPSTFAFTSAGDTPRLNWAVNTSFPLPATITVSNLANASIAPLIIGRIV